MKISFDDFLNTCEQIWRKLRICSYLLKKLYTKNVILCEFQPFIFQC